MPRIIENKLIEHFRSKKYFTRNELFDFYRHYESDLSEGTLAWRIYDLKKRNIIKSPKRGIYSIFHKPDYDANISADLLEIAKQLNVIFSDVQHCIWETRWLNEFTQHQVSRSIKIIEIEKGLEESLFYFLKDNTKNHVFLSPDEKTINLYTAESISPIVVKGLLSRSPFTTITMNNLEFQVPSLEKILVDIYADSKLFYHFQGGELVYIYRNAVTNYNINFTKMLSYAKRRGRFDEIKNLLKNHLHDNVKDIIDD